MVLHGYNVVKEALLDQGDEFLGRGSFPIVEDSQKGHGMFQTKLQLTALDTRIFRGRRSDY